ncbi:hypothetical protein P3T21_007607 [Paraburkholderia sp. GAS334]
MTHCAQPRLRRSKTSRAYIQHGYKWYRKPLPRSERPKPSPPLPNYMPANWRHLLQFPIHRHGSYAYSPPTQFALPSTQRCRHFARGWSVICDAAHHTIRQTWSTANGLPPQNSAKSAKIASCFNSDANRRLRQFSAFYSPPTPRSPRAQLSSSHTRSTGLRTAQPCHARPGHRLSSRHSSSYCVPNRLRIVSVVPPRSMLSRRHSLH